MKRPRGRPRIQNRPEYAPGKAPPVKGIEHRSVVKTPTVVLDAEIIEGFQKIYLWNQFDEPVETAQFHREMWSVYCSGVSKIAFAAPRGHAKSSAITHTLALAILMFRIRNYMLIVSDTEGQAVKFLQDIRTEVTENEDLIGAFGIARLEKDSETEIVVLFNDGYRFNLSAKGSEQKVRGLKWRNKRPNIVIVDDFENDESVTNPDRRKKLRMWFQNALLNCGSKSCVYLVVGTILHTDSLLERLLANDQWVSRRYRAHRGFNDFSEILWPEQFSEERLRSIRQEMINEGNADGYSQEMLSESVSAGNEFFKESDFRYFDPDEPMGPVLHYIALDLAVSTKAKADWTVATVAAIKPSGHINIVEVIRARQDSVATMEMLFDLQEKYQPESFLTEKGVITQSIGPFIDMEMISRQTFLTIEEITKSIDKRKAAKSIQGRMRAGGVAFDKEADWFPDFKSELLKFDRGAHDDQVDTMALLGMYLAKAARPQSEEEMEEELYEDEWRESGHDGRNLTTGY